MSSSESRISLSIGEVSRLLGVSPGILRSWEREALVIPNRTRGGHRVYGERHLRRLRKVARLYCDEKLNPAAIRREVGEAERAERTDRYVDGRLGANLRSTRKRRNMTLSQASEKSGLSPSFISALERGNTGVSVNSLFRLAEAIGTTLPTLTTNDLDGGKHHFVPADRRRRFVTDDESLLIEDIIFKPAGMEAEIAHIAPGRDSDGFYSHRGQEFLFILTGELSFWLGPDEFYAMKTGDALYLHSHRPHRWANESRERTSVLWVNAALPGGVQPEPEPRRPARRD